jgi:hypothetical protein
MSLERFRNRKIERKNIYLAHKINNITLQTIDVNNMTNTGQNYTVKLTKLLCR